MTSESCHDLQFQRFIKSIIQNWLLRWAIVPNMVVLICNLPPSMLAEICKILPKLWAWTAQNNTTFILLHRLPWRSQNYVHLNQLEPNKWFLKHPLSWAFAVTKTVILLGLTLPTVDLSPSTILGVGFESRLSTVSFYTFYANFAFEFWKTENKQKGGGPNIK